MANWLQTWTAKAFLAPCKALGVFALAFVLLGFASCAVQQPHTDRNWYPYLARDIDVTREGDDVAINPVTDWRYDATGPIAENYTEAAFNIADVKRVWFVLEPQPGSDLAAHTFLIFEFPDDRLIGVTIEARREEHEDYDAVRGAFNTFELAYVWGSARDLLTRRAVMLDHNVFVYPIVLTETQQRDLLSRLVGRTEALETHPRFYNTLYSNCTNEIAKATDLKWNIAFILTGLSDEHLYEQGFLPGARFEEAHARADVTEFVQSWNESAQPGASFDADALAELRRRWGQ
jgi:hypothetical protein